MTMPPLRPEQAETHARAAVAEDRSVVATAVVATLLQQLDAARSDARAERTTAFSQEFCAARGCRWARPR